MSAATPQRSNTMQTILFMMVVFMGFQIWQQSTGAKSNDKRTSTEVFAKMQQLNRDVLDVQIEREMHTYETKVHDEAKTSKMTPAQVDDLILKGKVLVSDTKFKSGLIWKSHAHTKIQRAYDIIKERFEKESDQPRWQAKVAVAPDGTRTATEISAADLYRDLTTDLSVRNRTELVYGLFPGYPLIDVLVAATGRIPGFSYAFACFLLALVVRAAVWPLSQKQYLWGRQIQQLTPMLKELEETFRDKKTGVVDQAAYQQASFGLYKEYGINPMAGCGPALIQIPFFFTVFQCINLYRFEFTKGVFLWVNPGSTRFLGLPVGPNLGERDYILIFIYAITMVITTLLTPVSDPSQKKQQKLMGIFFAVVVGISMFFYPLASAFILYWIFTNILATGQALLVNRLPMPALEKKTTPHGGLLPILEGLAKKAATEQAAAKDGSNDASTDFFTKTGARKGNKAKKKN